MRAKGRKEAMKEKQIRIELVVTFLYREAHEGISKSAAADCIEEYGH